MTLQFCLIHIASTGGNEMRGFHSCVAEDSSGDMVS